MTTYRSNPNRRPPPLIDHTSEAALACEKGNDLRRRDVPNSYGNVPSIPNPPLEFKMGTKIQWYKDFKNN